MRGSTILTLSALSLLSSAVLAKARLSQDDWLVARDALSDSVEGLFALDLYERDAHLDSEDTPIERVDARDAELDLHPLLHRRKLKLNPFSNTPDAPEDAAERSKIAEAWLPIRQKADHLLHNFYEEEKRQRRMQCKFKTPTGEDARKLKAMEQEGGKAQHEYSQYFKYKCGKDKKLCSIGKFHMY